MNGKKWNYLPLNNLVVFPQNASGIAGVKFSISLTLRAAKIVSGC